MRALLRFPGTLLLASTWLLGMRAPAEDGPGERPTKSITAVTPIFGQLVAIAYPPHFKGVFQRTRIDFYIQESVLDGETVDHWSQMITLTGKQGAALNAQGSPEALVLNMAGGFQRACPTTFSIVELGSRKVDGYDAFEAISSCGSVAGGAGPHSETAIILAIKGAEDFYTIQWAERGPASERPLALDRNEWVSRFTQLEPVRICARIVGELPPYLSCVGRK
jgi:hypothetical protein